MVDYGETHQAERDAAERRTWRTKFRERAKASGPRDKILIEAKTRLAKISDQAADEAFWLVVRENCERVEDAARFVPVAFGDITPFIDDEDRELITAAASLLPAGNMTEETWGAWTSTLKSETGRKGKGLFMPLRKALTGMERGPSVGDMLVLMGRARALQRLA